MTVAYGCLHIHYDRINMIIHKIVNYKIYGCDKIGNIDEDIKSKLNELYKIKEDK